MKKPGSGVERDEATVRPRGGENQASPSGSTTSEEQIRMRAYELYRERGGRVGDDMADWLRAEREYFQNTRSTTADPAGERTSASAPSAIHA